MATNLIQIKRTSVAGRAANTTTLPNPGELALNMTDGIMYSTNGSVVFEVGANNTNQRVTGTLTVNAISANGSTGTAGQVLTSNGTTSYWATSSTLNAQQSTYTYTLAANTTTIQGADDATQTLSYVAGLESVFINGVRQISGADYNTTNSTAITLTANAISGEVVQVIAWTGSINSTNVNAQFAWTNTHSFSNTIAFNGAITSASLADAVGYKGLPQNQQTSAYTLVLADMGKHIYATAANFAITVPANATTAFPIGAAITIVVEDQQHTVAPAANVTLVLAGTGAATTGTRTLAQGAVATLLKVGTNRWYISGAGVT